LFGNRLPQTHDVQVNAGCSGGLLPTSPPAEKVTTRQEEAGKASTGDWAGNWCGIGSDDAREVPGQAKPSRHPVVSFVVGVVLAMLIDAGAFILLVSQQ